MTNTASSSSSSSSSVQVAIRIRPFLHTESGSTKCVSRISSKMIQIGGTSYKKTFTFDHALDPHMKQKDVYDTCVLPLTLKILDGYNATVFAYGQTSSGKTFTITGGYGGYNHNVDDDDDDEAKYDNELEGVVPRALKDLFRRLKLLKRTRSRSSYDNDNDRNNIRSSFEYEVRVQYLEVYGEDVRDLLGSSSGKSCSNLKIRDAYKDGDEPEAVGANELTVDSAEEALNLIEQGSFRR